MSILLVFFCFKLMFFSGRAFRVFELLQSQVRFPTELSRHAVLCWDGRRRFEHSEDGMMGCTAPNDHHRGNNSIDLFCYKMCMFPRENISKQTGVFSRWILLLKINIHCPLIVFFCIRKSLCLHRWISSFQICLYFHTSEDDACQLSPWRRHFSVPHLCS